MHAFLHTIKDAMRRGKAAATLQVRLRHNGSEPLYRFELIENMIKEGATVEITKRGERRLMRPNGSFLDEQNTTKIGMDYASYLTCGDDSVRAVWDPTPSLKDETAE